MVGTYHIWYGQFMQMSTQLSWLIMQMSTQHFLANYDHKLREDPIDIMHVQQGISIYTER